MATVHAPRHPHPHSISSSSASSNHSPFRRVHRVTYAPPPPAKSSSASAAAAASTSTSSTAVPRAHHPHHPAPTAHPPAIDTYYGHEDTSKLCARFVSHTFNCPEILPLASSPSSSTNSSSTAVVSRSTTTVATTTTTTTGTGPGNAPAIPNTLAHFVAYALHRTRLHPSVVFTALALLHRLKARFPAARGSSGHRLFLAAYMLASKVVCDDTYSNKSWAVVGQGMFALREINQMEREMLGYLEWGLNVPGEDLARFEREVRRVYGNGNGRDGNGRDGWGRGVEMRLVAGVGGAQPPQDTAFEDPGSLALLAIPSTGGNAEKSPNHPHQLPTPTDAGPAVVPVPAPIGRPVLPPILTAATSEKPPAYPSPPTSPRSASTSVSVSGVNTMCHSECSSASTSPVDGDDSDSEYHYSHTHSRLAPDSEEKDRSPSPASSEDSATLPTPPNSALSASAVHGPHQHHSRGVHRAFGGYESSGAGQGVKMGKSHSVPGFQYASRERETGREDQIGRSSAPPVSIPTTTTISGGKREREAVVSVSASHFGNFGSFGAVANLGGGRGGLEEDGDAVMDMDMELEDEKRGGVAYYATVHPVRPASASITVGASAPARALASASAAARKDVNTNSIREARDREGQKGRRERDGRSLRTYTVPCAW